LSSAVEDDNWIDLYSPSGPGVFDDMGESVNYLAKAANTDHSVGKKGSSASPGKCSLNATTDIIEVPIDLAKDAIDEAESGGNALVCTKELQNAMDYFEVASIEMHKEAWEKPQKVFSFVL
jgi:hypothetical protein